MNIYTVKQITEADYGCEDTGRKGPMALLSLEEIMSGEMRYTEVSEERLAEQGISEEKKVCFTESGDIMKYVRVAAAIIYEIRDGVEYIFSTAKGYGKYKGWWEFPGGKIEEGETSKEALKREIREELTVEIEVGDLLITVEYNYPDFHLSMDCFLAKVVSGQIELKEAEAARWLSKKELDSVKWLPADSDVIDMIRQTKLSE